MARADYLDKVAKSEDAIILLRDELSRRDEHLAALASGIEDAVSNADSVAETIERWRMHLRRSEEASAC